MDSYGTAVPANGYYGTSTTGAVSVINTADPTAAVTSIAVGLHPTALYSPAKGVLFVANTNSDTVSVIDTKKDKVVQTIDTKPWASSDTGYEPTGIALTADDHLLVTLGRANAVAVYQYEGDPLEPVSYIGLIPTDYYPADIAHRRQPDLRHQHPRHRRARPEPLVQQGRRHDARDRSRHAQHHRVADPLRAAQGQGHREDLHQRGLLPERVGQEGRAADQGQEGRRRARPGPHRRPLDDQARLPDRQGEPHLRSGLRRHHARATATRRWRSSARRSRPTSTRWPSSSASTTTPTTSARTRPRATTG